MAEGIRVQDVLVLIIYLVIIIVAAYYLTKLVAKKSMQKGMKHSGSVGLRSKKVVKNDMLSVVDRIPIDREKSVMVVEFENHYYLIGVSATEFKLFDKKEISKEELIKRAMNAVKEREQAQTDGEEEEPFSKRFSASFKEVASNYFKKDKANISFNKTLQKEMQKEDSIIKSKKKDTK